MEEKASPKEKKEKKEINLVELLIDILREKDREKRTKLVEAME